jgi:hypothetical protein
MPETATAPPTPAPQTIAVPLLSPESFEGLVAVVETLATVADMTEEGLRIEVQPTLDQAIRVAGGILARVERDHEKLSDPALYAWAARASGLAVFAANLAAKLLAEITDRHAARASAGLVGPDGVTPAAAAPVLVGPDLRPVTPTRPTLPPHLQALVGAHTFSIEPMPGTGFHRVVCHTCHKALGEVQDLATAELIGATHAAARGNEKVEWTHPETFRALAAAYDVPTCGRCGCTERNACLKVLDLGPDKPRPVIQHCSWAQLNPETNAGVCTACAE